MIKVGVSDGVIDMGVPYSGNKKWFVFGRVERSWVYATGVDFDIQRVLDVKDVIIFCECPDEFMAKSVQMDLAKNLTVLPARRASPLRSHFYWLHDEVEYLKYLHSNGENIKNISSILERSCEAITLRLQVLGIDTSE